MDLTLESLIQALQASCSAERGPDQDAAEAQLKHWETAPGYHFQLQTVYLDLNQPLQIRWLAIICFKNGVEKYWRASRQNSIGKDEKVAIRARVFDAISEANTQLAIQNAHACARIVRFDFPTEWPTLFEDTEALLQTALLANNVVQLHNLLIALNQIVKTLALVRIGRARHAMQAKAGLITPTLIRLYTRFFQEWTRSMDLTAMEVGYLCLKTLRRVVVEGYEQPHKDQDVAEFVAHTVAHFQLLVREHGKYSSDLLEKYVKGYGKLYYNLLSANATAFVLMPCLKDVVMSFLSILENQAQAIYEAGDDFWEAVAIRAVMVLKKLIGFVYKKGAMTLRQKSDKKEIDAAVAMLSSQIFTPELIKHLIDLVIAWYLKLKPSDLESWSLEPEEWVNEELSTSWEYQIRPCAENFFQDLISFFKDFLTEYILHKISNELLSDNVLTKDAILATFQLASSAICDAVDFDTLLTTVFIPEALRNDLSESRLIKRRVCLILSEWVPIKCARESRVAIFRLLLALLDPANPINDKVVKLTAVQTLSHIVDDWEFNKHDFQPFLDDYVRILIRTLPEMELTESKLFVLRTLSIVIERCNPLLSRENLMNILAIVPDLWKRSNESAELILKNSLLRVLKHLTVSLNENSPETYAISLPLISVCCTESSELYSLLSEDGYELWAAILLNFPDSTPDQLVAEFPLVVPGLLNSTEILPLILTIVRSYALISPDLFVSDTGMEVFRVLSGYLPNMRDDSLILFASTFEILVLNSSEKFLAVMVESGLFSAMISYCLDENESPISVNKVLMVVSRLVFAQPALFLQMMTHVSSSPDMLSKVLENWLKYFSNNGNPRNKKISILGLLALVRSKNETVLYVASPIFAKAFELLEEVNESASGDAESYHRDFAFEFDDVYIYEESPDIKPSGEKLRYKALIAAKDPVHKLLLKDYIKETVNFLRAEFNDEDFNKFMAILETHVVDSFLLLMS
ncbi:hypothetical protein BABINDRAFT_170982 [Babjeviella inositovora NRRL Y-12698]|uniref:Importin N-terminal domain-containing protein n=1 Tax=Babjeviella inositovora NRRL Y-12698 TaxID=984486 RepID=A0A1E3QSA9_9ASCO|nr:uncharacterized protein BABINDRAFT_170982 [Babjeviella inositovora NRRL Y-12698]ODQ80596.1 hypothetical protein BABINDRAFT_170982 [Babjeviella inositovora NRRL Y-12698]